MNETLNKIIKSLNGSLLGIGIENKNIITSIEKNNNINTCYLLESVSKKGSKFSFKGKRKKVNIKKLKKYFTKKRTNIIICNFKYIKKFIRNFIPGSVYINNDKLYIYGKMSKEEIEDITKKYNRYTNDIEIKNIDGEYLITINNKNTKNNFLKDKLYSIIDLINSIIDLITNILIN